MISKSFSSKLDEISQEMGMNPRDLLLVMYLESGVNPAARNPHGGATGLIQFMPQTLEGMGLSKEQVATFGQQSAEDQLDFVKKYVQSHRNLIGGQPFSSATQYYVANFWPIALKKWDGSDPIRNKNVVIVSARSNDPGERGAYNANKILDTNNDGVITVGDITNILMRMEKSSGFQNMLAQFNSVAGQGSVSEKKQENKYDDIAVNNSQVAMFLNQVEKFLNNVATIKPMINKMSKSKLLISIESDNDFASKLEYSRVLQATIKEELGAKSEIFTDANGVEIQCFVDGDKNKSLNAMKQLCSAVSDVFEYATRKIGGVKIYSFVFENEDPSYQTLDIKLAEINYRKFNLKFVNGK